MPKTYYLDNAFVNAALRNTPFASPPTVYAALFTVAPTAGGGGTEVAGGGYARQAVMFTLPANGVTSNAADVIFPIAMAPWGTLVAFGLYDQSVGGNLLYFNMLSVPRSVAVNDQVRFPVGQLIASEA